MVKQRFQVDSEFPKSLDNNDPLGHFRQRFYIQKGTVYMCGNSLGLLSKDAEDAIFKVLQRWKEDGVKIWNSENGMYYSYSNFLAEKMAPLIGVEAEEVVVLGCTTSNIHQAVSTFYKPNNKRYKILVDELNFPTDRYAIDSQVRLKGYVPEDAVKVVKSHDGKWLDEGDVIDAMTDDVTLALLPTVFYRSAHIFDMKKVSRAARERGIIIGWDLSHAIGSIPMDLKSLDIDFAVWCTYKYLNGGPGSTAGLYINRRHFDELPGLAGWFGNKAETQFMLRQEFEHEKDASGWQIGTPSLLSMAALEGSLEMVNEAGIHAMRGKSLKLTGYLMFLIEERLSEFGFLIGNPREDSKRGGHVSVEHPEAYRISIALKERGVIPDFRDPNVLRLAPMALYTTFEEIYQMVDILVDIMKSERYKDISLKRNLVV